MADYKSLDESRFEGSIIRQGRFVPDGQSKDSSAARAVHLEVHLGQLTKELNDLLLSKHKDYGPKNISLAPGGAINGLRVRMHDKTARINHLIDNAKYKNPEHESLRDSFLDLANYAMIALLVIDGNWPSQDSGPDCD